MSLLIRRLWTRETNRWFFEANRYWSDIVRVHTFSVIKSLKKNNNNKIELKRRSYLLFFNYNFSLIVRIFSKYCVRKIFIFIRKKFKIRMSIWVKRMIYFTILLERGIWLKFYSENKLVYRLLIGHIKFTFCTPDVFFLFTPFNSLQSFNVIISHVYMGRYDVFLIMHTLTMIFSVSSS